ncbi:putative zinc finger protein [Hirsutella rhossiliensis]|uniref:Zinc finger protein n=1 Tax=Hirsutella rhossiliensis TaxID=111463 RepID=A0A9P8MV60_9HYPO|nr:putative zinc finger protein [Hirsutella rhossiliensis]KAH0959772.1 putative zinc finger protein [Hirsutella rhossiliensis]
MASDFECGTCGKTFPAGWRARDNHCNSTGHSRPSFECDVCPRWFGSQQACNQHMRDTGHWQTVERYECACCYDTWPTEEQCTEHEHQDHNYCAECNRTFQNFNNLTMHLRSRAHRGQQIECPFCKNDFATAAGLTHHLEAGACSDARDLNRDAMYRFVRGKDPCGLISKHLIGWTGSAEYEASNRAWNGTAYECYLCHRAFRLLAGLNQHLNSPRHQQALYHCPNYMCAMDFRSLAAVINHLESEACGCTRFETVQRKIGDMVSGNRLITF